MKTTIPKLFLAAALVASIPFPGRASACDDDHRAPVPATYRDHDGQGDRSGRPESWRERERARLRVELASLDRQRDAFRSRWRNPGKVHRFERWYAAQRADLQRQWDALSWYAAR
jgi:hypothetical protein